MFKKLFSDKGAEARDKRYEEALDKQRLRYPLSSEDIEIAYTPIEFVKAARSCGEPETEAED